MPPNNQIKIEMEADARPVVEAFDDIDVRIRKLERSQRRLARQSKQTSDETTRGARGMRGVFGELEGQLTRLTSTLGKAGALGGALAIGDQFRQFQQGQGQQAIQLAQTQAGVAQNLGIQPSDPRLAALGAAQGLPVGPSTRFGILDTLATQVGAQRGADELFSVTQQLSTRGARATVGSPQELLNLSNITGTLLASTGLRGDQAVNVALTANGLAGNINFSDDFRRFVNIGVRNRGNLSEEEAVTQALSLYIQARQQGIRGSQLGDIFGRLNEGLTSTVAGQQVTTNLPSNGQGIFGQFNSLLDNPSALNQVVTSDGTREALLGLRRGNVSAINQTLSGAINGAPAVTQLDPLQEASIEALTQQSNLESLDFQQGIAGVRSIGRQTAEKASLQRAGFGSFSGAISGTLEAIRSAPGITNAENQRQVIEEGRLNITISGTDEEYQAVSSIE